MSGQDVFFFVKFDARHGGSVLQSRPATRDAIRAAGGTPLLDSAWTVAASDLDDEGFLRQPTRACESCGQILKHVAVGYRAEGEAGPRWDQLFACHDCRVVWTYEGATGRWRRHGIPTG